MMPMLTAAVIAAFVGYSLAWYVGWLEGNFALLLFMATVVTGVYWLAEQFYFLPRRRRAAAALPRNPVQLPASAGPHEGLASANPAPDETGDELGAARHRILLQPWWLDWTAGLFPVIVVVFLLRSFVVEPFKIPSGSMIPTLQVGDLILVNKFTYGLRLPVLNIPLTQGRPPQRGDVMVFRYPPHPSLDYIKRVVGVPGDEVAYLNKRLFINGQPMTKEVLPDYFDAETMRYFKQFQEKLGSHSHRLLNNEERGAFVEATENFPHRANCRYSVEGVVCKVPEGHYFMMGDNRDNSLDSRYWGFVPDRNIVGRAFFVWMNFWDIKRIGSFQ